MSLQIWWLKPEDKLWLNLYGVVLTCMRRNMYAVEDCECEKPHKDNFNYDLG